MEMEMPRYSKDPRWITVRYRAACNGCGAKIKMGDEAFYYPTARALYGKACGCGEERSGDFAAAAFDEAQYSGSW